MTSGTKTGSYSFTGPYAETRSQAWQEGERGALFEERLEAIEEALTSVEEAIALHKSSL